MEARERAALDAHLTASDDRGNEITKAELDEALRRDQESAAHFYGTSEQVTPASIISADDIARRLLELPAEIAKAEARFVDAEQQVVGARWSLQRTEDDLLTTSAALIDGKNEAIRAAQMRAHTQRQRERLQDVEENLRWARRDLNQAQNEFSALRAIVRILEGRNDG